MLQKVSNYLKHHLFDVLNALVLLSLFSMIAIDFLKGNDFFWEHIRFTFFIPLYIAVISFFGRYAVVYIQTKKIRWWQIKIDDDVFNIFKWWQDNPHLNTFTWIPEYSSRNFGLAHRLSSNDSVVNIRKGDKIIFWIHGITSGIYALGRVLEKPSKTMGVSIPNTYFTKNIKQKDYFQVKIEYLYKIFDNPISYEYCISNNLADFIKTRDKNKIGNLSATHSKHFFIETDSLDSRPGKLDVLGYVPVKPIWKETWDELFKVITSEARY